MTDHRQRQFAFARLLSHAVASQALLSASSFAVGLILIRHVSDAQYAYCILVFNAVLLLASLQNAVVAPAIAHGVVGLDDGQRGRLVGGVYRRQQRWLAIAGAAAAALIAGSWWGGLLAGPLAALLLATVVAGLAVLYREYFRIVLFALQRPLDVLRCDAAHVALLVSGVFLATLSAGPAVAAVLAMCLAAAGSGGLLARALRRRLPETAGAGREPVAPMGPMAAWSAGGAAIHWTFSQGYVYLVAATLDVRAVAAIAATRLLLMPMNLLSTGIGSLMLPLASGWLQRHGVQVLQRRLLAFALAMGLATMTYFALVWWWRDWIFEVLLKKQFDQRDPLLMLWGLLFLVTVVRDQLAYLLAAQGRFRAMTLMTLVSAAVSLSASYGAMHRLGVAGALVGMLIGECISVLGVMTLSRRQPALVEANQG